MIGQHSYNVKPVSPAAAFSSDPYVDGSEVLGTPFTAASCPPTPALPLPTPGDLRRLAKAPHPTHLLKCPRCDSPETKFCYYNNYSLSQPRYFCKNCKRYWTAGGALRNVPVGGGLRKNKRCKLKLQAEAEAAAAAAAAERELQAAQEASNQLQLHEANQPQSPVLASSGTAIGSSSTSCASSIVTGIHTNFVVTAAPAAMIRTSSGSDGSSVETYSGSDNCGSTGAAGAYMIDRQQNGSQLQQFFGELCAAQAAVPQFYSGYSKSLPARNLQKYRGTVSSERGASYHEFGYVNQLVDMLREDKSASSNPTHANNGEATYHVFVSSDGNLQEGGDGCSHDLREEKEEIVNANLQYDWQSISDSLFNGAPAEGFLPLPGGSWSDFSQFQDLAG